MSKGKARQIWMVNVISFILLAVLVVTGFSNWMLLPRGFQGGGGFLVSVRHFFLEVHEWTSLLFLITIAVHLVLHWSYIRVHLKKP